MGNKKVNDMWEAVVSLEKFPKPNGNSSVEEKKSWIIEKYIKKTFKGVKQGYLFVKSSETRKLKRFWVVLADTTLKIYERKDVLLSFSSPSFPSPSLFYFYFLLYKNIIYQMNNIFKYKINN